MSWRLRDGLAFCVIDGAAIFLDVPADRYFRLAPSANQAFLRFIAGEDRSAKTAIKLSAMQLIAGDGAGFCYSPTVSPSPVRAASIADEHLNPGAIARALWMEWRVERRLARSSLAQALAQTRAELRLAGQLCLPGEMGPGPAVTRILHASDSARLLRSAADRCLPRSIALGLALARIGFRSQVILAVKLGPFAAHCWVQAGDVVLNDTAEEVARFTSILVI